MSGCSLLADSCLTPPPLDSGQMTPSLVRFYNYLNEKALTNIELNVS